ncbi:MAG TPA: type I DNA topoisomerase [Clostridia bacterium]|nr:type I DNA topoisomerase [Clostridia bacterium]
MSKLVIVESPAKAKSIKKYLGKGYEVTSSMGHIRDLPAARLSVDVKNDFEPKYSVIKGKEKLVKELKSLVAQSDQVFLATDPDREGEAISWHLAVLLGLDLNAQNRITFNEVTKTGVKGGMANPREVDMDLVNAQQARRILDRLVGYRLSPFVSQKIRRGLSAGRVQSVAVKLISDREAEINAFVPEEYWSLDAKFLTSQKRTFDAAFYGDETGKVKITSKAQADEYLARLDGADFNVKSVKKGTRKKNPAPPFITSTLQQEASRLMGFQSHRTMRAAQQLYEGVDVSDIGTTGLITYMRTDSLRVSEEARAQGNEYIKSVYGDNYLPEKPRYFKSKANAQDGHEAIRPTIPSLSPEKVKENLTPDQFKIYNIVWKRFMASLMASCIQNTIRAEIIGQKENADGHCIFSASGFSIKFDGYTTLYGDAKDEDEKGGKELPEFKQGDSLKLKELKGNQHFTQPPPRYTEASLIKSLEENGIGRPSTYASIISTITKREYVKRSGKALEPTELGITITKLLEERFARIVNVKFTAEMETSLDKVGEGEANHIEILHTFYDDFEKTLAKAKEEMKDVKITLEEDITDIPCEKCGKMMVIKSGRYGKFLACPGYPECKNAKPYILETDAVCPKCGATVIEKKSKKGHTFFGCKSWPDCEFMTWDMPTAEKCPQCDKSLFKKRVGTLVCLDENCGYEKKVERKKKAKKD